MSFTRTTADAMVSPVVTHLHLLRHGRVDTGNRRVAYGWTDYALSERGRAENEALLAFARTLPRPDGVLSSDLSRCLALAEPLADQLQLPLRVETALREQHMGDWEGEAWDDLQHRFGTAVNDYWLDYANAVPPGGESFAQACARVNAFWRTRPELEGGRWLVASHVGPLRALLCEALGKPFDEALRFAPAHGSHTLLMRAEAGSVLQVLGEVPGGAATAEQYVAGPRRRTGGRRIALAGSAGTGKTTLGQRLAQELGVPFLEEGIRARLEAGLDLHALDRAGHQGLLAELWAEQIEREEQAVAERGGFVSDRSPCDFAAFALLFHNHDEGFCAAHVPGVLQRVPRYDAVIVLPHGVLPLVDDGVRSTNAWYQRLMQSTIEGLVQRHVEPGRAWFLPGLTELEQRLRWVKERV